MAVEKEKVGYLSLLSLAINVVLCHNIPLSLNFHSSMDVFTSLPGRTKLIILVVSLALFSFSLGALVFGDNIIGHENALIEQAQGAAKVDLLYSEPHAH